MSNFTHHAFRGIPALHYVVGPTNGPPLLLLHGVTRDWTDWKPLLPDLISRWQVFVLDHRGHGQSEHAPGEYRVLDYAHDAGRFVRKTFSQPVTVLGHSLGAMVALWLAAECPQHIASIILEDPPFHTMGKNIAATPYQAQFAGMQKVARGKHSEIEAATDDLANVEVPVAGEMKRLGDLRDRESLRFSAGCLMQVDPDIFSPLVAGEWLEEFDHEALWPQVKCPALLLQGDPAAGGALTNDDVAVAREKCPHLKYQFFPGVGHQIHRTRPAEVIAAVNDFTSVARSPQT